VVNIGFGLTGIGLCSVPMAKNTHKSKRKRCDIVEAKNYLKQIRMYDAKIESLMEELARVKAMATKVTTAISGETVSGSKNPDKMTDVVAKIIKLQEELNGYVDKFVDMKQEAIKLLSKVENPIYYQVLHSRYILYKTWEQIACDMDFTYQWVCQLHGRALQEFGGILEKTCAVDRN
jgi:seryl-tRNA synthetase